MVQARILLVEDDAKARMLLAHVLSDAQYHVATAPDGETAIQMLAQQLFDVVLTDIRMRTIDGIQVLHAAKSLARPPAVILLTGYGSLETSIAALRLGADDYLLKPCEPIELLRCVAHAVQHHQEQARQAEAMQYIVQGIERLRGGEPPATRSAMDATGAATQDRRYIEVGRLRIDCFRHCAMFDGAALPLTPIEYTLLHCLAEAQGCVLSYAEIVRRSHGQSMDESEAQLLLKAHIRNLRRKIEPAYLVNVRGTGYLLSDPESSAAVD